jgi:hypothetical protein
MRILEADDAASRLQLAARILQSAGALAAYEAMASKSVARLRGLGPAFGTKILYFCPQAQPPLPQALILDRLVADWLRRHTDVNMSPTVWRVVNYRRYLAIVEGWADELDVRPDVVEQSIFIARSQEVGNQWGAG